MKKKSEIPKLKKRIFLCVVGVFLSAVAVSFFKSAVFGVDPFQALMSGLDASIPIAYGSLYVLVNAVLLCFSLLFDRSRIGLGTLINLFFFGFIAQFGMELLSTLIPKPGFLIRCIYLLISLLLACLAGSMYYTANLGVSTYDAISLIISGTWGKWEFKYVRMTADGICICLGVLLYLTSGSALSGIGAVVGVGSVLSAFCTGPMIDYFNNHLFEPMLEK